VESKPDLIAVDAGSTDPGPYYLGSGKSFTDRKAVKRDLGFIIGEGVRRSIPVVVGSCGGAGASPHLDWTVQIVRELAGEKKISFRMGVIPADISKKSVRSAIAEDRIRAVSPLPPLTPETVDEATRIVAQMGVEPIIDALDQGCNVVLCGRAYDPAVFAALPIKLGFDKGPALHMGKILECAAIAADPGSGADCAMGTLSEKGFILETLNPVRRFTTLSTAAHSLYEKSDPYHLAGPGGVLDLSETNFEQATANSVFVTGSKFIPSDRYWIKLEGSRRCGFRSISMAGVRDPIMIERLDAILEQVDRMVSENFAQQGVEGKVYFRLYGKNGVMGSLEPAETAEPKEIGILIEALAPTQEQADTVCSLTRSTLLHYGYDGRISTAGNLAFPFSPSDVSCGEVYEFSIYHLMAVENSGPFSVEVEEL
jgi:hypothetical protein